MELSRISVIVAQKYQLLGPNSIEMACGGESDPSVMG